MSNNIVENLKKEIDNFSFQLKIEKVGKVMEVFDFPILNLLKW